MKYLQLVQLILQLFPLLIQTIKAVEDAIPGNGNGEQKLAMVRAVLESAYGAATDAMGSFMDIWPSLESTIKAIVTAFNATKVFEK